MPAKQDLLQLLGSSDFFLWEYYGVGILGKIQAWIFRSRIRVLMTCLRRKRLKPRSIVDLGCGSMFASYALFSAIASEYIGVDILPADKLKKYRDAMRNVGVESIEAIRASAESPPFRNEIFDFGLSLDVLEHLNRPTEAAKGIYRVVKADGVVAVSLPLENFFQKASRIGFILMKITREPFLKGTRVRDISITETSHYVGDVNSYDRMVKMLEKFFDPLLTRYTPIGFHKSFNINAVQILRKSSRHEIPPSFEKRH